MKRISFALRASSLLLLGGCAGITQLQDTVSHFAQAAHSTSTAEIAFLRSVQTIDQQTQFYNAAFQYATSKDNSHNFDVTGDYTSTILTPEKIATRQALMSALVLYADKMEAIACGDDDKQLDGSSQAVAGNLLAMAAAKKLIPGGTAVSQAAETAVDAIARMALDKVRYGDLKGAAASIQPHLAVVIKTLQDENNDLGQSVIANLGQIEIELRTVVASAHERTPNDAAATFFAIMQSRKLLTDTNAAITYPGDSSVPVKGEIAKPVNDALSAILNGNEAIAKKGVAGLSAATTDLYQRALAAKDFYEALAKTK